jgi:hypothetical protein
MVLRDFRRIGWSAEVKGLWWAFDKSIRGMPSADDREIWIRAPEYALRLGTVLAVYRGSGVWKGGLGMGEERGRAQYEAVGHGAEEEHGRELDGGGVDGSD